MLTRYSLRCRLCYVADRYCSCEVSSGPLFVWPKWTEKQNWSLWRAWDPVAKAFVGSNPTPRTIEKRALPDCTLTLLDDQRQGMDE